MAKYTGMARLPARLQLCQWSIAAVDPDWCGRAGLFEGALKCRKAEAVLPDVGVATCGREVCGRDVLELLDGRAASLLLEGKEKRVHAAAAFLRTPHFIGAKPRFI